MLRVMYVQPAGQAAIIISLVTFISVASSLHPSPCCRRALFPPACPRFGSCSCSSHPGGIDDGRRACHLACRDGFCSGSCCEILIVLVIVLLRVLSFLSLLQRGGWLQQLHPKRMTMTTRRRKTPCPFVTVCSCLCSSSGIGKNTERKIAKTTATGVCPCSCFCGADGGNDGDFGAAGADDGCGDGGGSCWCFLSCRHRRCSRCSGCHHSRSCCWCCDLVDGGVCPCPCSCCFGSCCGSCLFSCPPFVFSYPCHPRRRLRCLK